MLSFPSAAYAIRRIAGAAVLAIPVLAGPSSASGQDVAGMLDALNQTDSVNTTDDVKSWQLVFDAWLETSPPPIPVGQAFNLFTVHPGMERWDEISGWAESNGDLAAAILESRNRTLFGLPYGEDAVASKYREAGISANVAEGGDLTVVRFPWLDAMDGITAFATAEMYRLMELGRADDGLDLALATTFLLRQCCDREFRSEQDYMITLLTGSLDNLRDVFYLYRDAISSDRFATIARNDLPFLRPDRGRLLMPEGDKAVAVELLKSVFDRSGQADRDKFALTFASRQSGLEPLTVFGAGRRWRLIADIHDSLDSSLERLDLVYDDWWRRWRVQEYDAILSIPSEWDRTNPIRFAAVLYSIEDVQGLFSVRDYLYSATQGTIMAAGLCAYDKRFSGFPTDIEATYALAVRARSNRDPYDREFAPFKYRRLDGVTRVDTPFGRVRVESGTGFLYSRGPDRADNRGETHSDSASVTGEEADIVFWPPLKALQREQGLRP
ncbi:MAG: hypothetical protein AB8G96_11250 [Phycisphaerales bacterium]